MSDARLRDAERRWRETGAIDDEAAWLVERVRAGLNRRLHLEWLTFLGDAGAERAVEALQHLDARESGLDPLDRAVERDNTLWASSLVVDDRAVALRVVLALADGARCAQAPDFPLVRRAIEVLAGRVLGTTSEDPVQYVGGSCWTLNHAYAFVVRGDADSFYDALVAGVHALGRPGAIAVMRDTARAWWVEGRDMAVVLRWVSWRDR